MKELCKLLDLPKEKVKQIQDIVKQPISFSMPVGDDDSCLGDFIDDTDATSIFDRITAKQLKESIEKTLDTLTPREAKVLRMRFGMSMNSEKTLEEAGNQFDVTRERIRQIEAGALRKLRKPLRAAMLRGYLEKANNEDQS